MAERGIAALDAGQRECLAALGFELLSLRSFDARPGALTTPTADESAPAPVRVRLVTRMAAGATSTGPQSALLRAVVFALGLDESEVSQASIAGVPTIAFGTDAGLGDIAAPALDQLRDAHAKRSLWPVLRRLRRQLQSDLRRG